MGLAAIYALDLSVVPVLADMEEAGVRVDVGTLEDYPRAFIRMVRFKHEKARYDKGKVS